MSPDDPMPVSVPPSSPGPPRAAPLVPTSLWVVAGLLLVGLWLVREALAPFFFALVVAYMLLPFVDRLSKRVGRPWATFLVLILAVGLVVGLAWAVLPMLMDQVYKLVENIPTIQKALWNRVQPLMQAHPWMLPKVQKLFSGLSLDPLLSGLKYASAGLLGFFLSFVTMLLVPVILYYMLLDGPTFLAGLEHLVPPRYRKGVVDFVVAVHGRLGGYIRGQLAVAAVMAGLHGLAFMFLKVPYGWLLGLVAGVSNVVPYSPYVTALPAALILAGSAGAERNHLLLMAVVFTVVQKVEALYLTPVWVGKASGLHPLAVLLAVVVFGFAFGLTGLILAVPLMIIIKVALERYLANYERLPWFRW